MLITSTGKVFESEGSEEQWQLGVFEPQAYFIYGWQRVGEASQDIQSRQALNGQKSACVSYF